MTAAIDHLTYNRQLVASAYRRLADAALNAAAAFTDPDTVPDESTWDKTVQGRYDATRHALIVVDATRRGIAKASAARRVA